MNTKRLLKVLVTVSAAMLVLSVSYGFNLWNIRGMQPGEEYTAYSHADGIRATYVEGYHVGDSILSCLTLLEATDTAGWALLYNDFGLTLHRDTAYSQHVGNGNDVMEVFLTQPAGDIAVASHRDSYICLFHVDDTMQRMLLFDAIYDKVFLSLTNNINFLENEKNI